MTDEELLAQIRATPTIKAALRKRLCGAAPTADAGPIVTRGCIRCGGSYVAHGRGPYRNPANGCEGYTDDPAAPCLCCGKRFDAHPVAQCTHGFQAPATYFCENPHCRWRSYSKPYERRCQACGARVWKDGSAGHRYRPALPVASPSPAASQAPGFEALIDAFARGVYPIGEGPDIDPVAARAALFAAHRKTEEERDRTSAVLRATEDLHVRTEAENIGKRIAAVKCAEQAEAEAERLTRALRDASSSLTWIGARRAVGEITAEEVLIEVRQYARSRADEARAALSLSREGDDGQKEDAKP